MSDFKIENCTANDIADIFRLYDMAIDYQASKKNVVVWPNFKHSLVEAEIKEHRLWKLLIDNETACVWAIDFNDEKIWEERENKTSIYIHRIATDSAFRGQNFVSIIVEWAKNYAKDEDKTHIRLDTLGNNKGLIKHYTNAGFDFLGIFNLKETSNLPEHYQENKGCCLFEIEL